MKKNTILKNEVRKKIYELIFNNPGLHFGKISRELKIPKTTLYHHISILQKQGKVKKHIEGRYHRYYASQEISSLDKKIINIFRQETSRNIVLYLLVNIGATQTELSENLEKHPTTIEFYLKKLLDIDLIRRLQSENKKIIIHRRNSKIIEYKPTSNDVIYRIKDPKSIYESIISHKSSFDDDSLDATLNLLENAIKERYMEKVPEKTTKPNSEVDEVLKRILKIFPLPWCA